VPRADLVGALGTSRESIPPNEEALRQTVVPYELCALEAYSPPNYGTADRATLGASGRLAAYFPPEGARGAVAHVPDLLVHGGGLRDWCRKCNGLACAPNRTATRPFMRRLGPPKTR